MKINGKNWFWFLRGIGTNDIFPLLIPSPSQLVDCFDQYSQYLADRRVYEDINALVVAFRETEKKNTNSDLSVSRFIIESTIVLIQFEIDEVRPGMLLWICKKTETSKFEDFWAYGVMVLPIVLLKKLITGRDRCVPGEDGRGERGAGSGESSGCRPSKGEGEGRKSEGEYRENEIVAWFLGWIYNWKSCSKDH